jgi:hypothetical protein
LERVDKTGSLVERVEKVLEASKASPEWGSPLLSTTPNALAIRELAAQSEALRRAIREVAAEVEKLSAPT